MNRDRPKKLETIQVKLTMQEKNQIKARSTLFAGGNLSMFVVRQALHAPAKHLVNDDHTCGRKVKRP